MALSSVVSEIFDVEKYHDLEIRVRGHSRSLIVIPFERMGVVFYWCSIVTFSLRCTVLRRSTCKYEMGHSPSSEATRIDPPSATSY